MTSLADLTPNEEAMVTKVKAVGELKRRLFSFGLRKNADLKVKAVSIHKSTMEVEIGHTMIALRVEEAKEIEVSRK